MPSKHNSLKLSAHFPTDRPILSANADRLSRKTFADGLAKRIQSWKGKDSLVIALCGEWGCGKTSLKNLTIEKLQKGANPKVDLLEFNPWEISGRNSLTSTFFNELALVIAPNKEAEASKNGTIRRLGLYGKAASFGGSVLKAIGGMRFASGNTDGILISTIADALCQSGLVANQGADLQETIEQSDEHSLIGLKRLLTSDMANLKRPILVIIDDIDRLTTDEIREVFQLVKANADFPNIIYLLMFDRKIVETALNTISGGRGHEFLDKIVQVLFHVPQPSMSSVHDIFIKGLNVYIDDDEVGKRWEQSRWDQVWPNGLSIYFTNLRCVYRFLCSFGFHVSQMRIGNAFELNPIDLIALETLRLFEPALYEMLPTKKSALVGVSDWTRYLNEEKNNEIAKTELNKLLTSVTEDKRANLECILTQLFPHLIGVNIRDEDLMVRHLQVGHYSFFDRYFTMSLSHDDVSQSDIDNLMKSITTPTDFAKICASLKSRGLLVNAIQRLDAYKYNFPKTVFPQLITTLIDVQDLFQEPLNGERLIYHGLRAIEDENERFTHFRNGLIASKGLRLMVEVVANEERRKEGPEHYSYIINEKNWHELKLIVVKQIRKFNSDSRLKDMYNLSYILYRWREWTNDDEVKKWINSNTVTGDDALWVLRTFLSTKYRNSVNGASCIRYIILDTLESFSNVANLEKLTESFQLSQLQKENQRALRAFRQALKWRAEGKPADYHGNTLDDDHPLAEDS